MKRPRLLRLYGLLQLIDRTAGIAVDEAAHEVACAARTIRRDLKVLQDAGFLLYLDRRRGRPFRWRFAEEGFKLAEALGAAGAADLSRNARFLLDQMREAAGSGAFGGAQLNRWREPTRAEHLQFGHGRPIGRRPNATHSVAEIIKTASLENWCCQPFCTTCGCMQFREAIRDLPGELVDEFLRMPRDPALERRPNFGRFLHLILLHLLRRTEKERLQARRDRQLATEEWERRATQARAATRDRKIARLAEKRRAAAVPAGSNYSRMSQLCQ